ncbi:MAG: hypothetical protein RML45_10875 [Acetobacteraceae bacterium]|nr:hypothetical protein [Acetobacteraceae bacterium]
MPSFVDKERLGAAAEWLPWRQIHLGLDLKGGSYLLLEVDMAAVIRERLDNLADGARTRLRGAGIGYTNLSAADRAVTLRLTDPSRAPEALRLLRELANPDHHRHGRAAARPRGHRLRRTASSPSPSPSPCCARRRPRRCSSRSRSFAAASTRRAWSIR